MRTPARKHISDRVASAVNVQFVQGYNKKLSPSQNLINFGLDPDVNSSAKVEPIDKKSAAFVGYTELPVVKKKKKMLEMDRDYIRGCIEKYGDDIVKMQKDFKVNFNQLTENKLQRLYNAYLEETA